MSFEDEKYIELFKEEASEHLQKLESLLLEIEKGSEPEKIKEAKRSAHTIKGSARLVGLEEIGNLAHKIEDVFKKIEDGSLSAGEKIVDALLQGVDAIKKAMEGSFDKMKDAVKVLENLLSQKEEKVEEPKEKVTDKKKFKEKRIQAVETVNQQQVESRVPEEKVDEKKREVFRVSAEKINNIINLAGELIMQKISYEGDIKKIEAIPEEFARVFAEKFKDSSHYADTAKKILREKISSILASIKDSSRAFSQSLFEIQQSALALKVVPFYTITDELKRYVREVSKAERKSVNLIVEGEDVELDRTVLEHIKPALMHIINNAIAHGIEEEEERRRLKKPPSGTISVKLYTSGSRIVLEVTDDGRGIDVKKIKDKALEQGIINEFQYESVTDEEAINFIFIHGFSTAAKLSQMAGRGVGMDVVKKAMLSVGGEVKIQTEKGNFTKVTLMFPQTTSVIKGLWVKIGGEKFVIPLYFVQKVLRLSDYEFVEEAGERLISINNKLIPVIDPLLAFGWGGYEGGTKYGILLKSGESYLCLYVDEIEQEEEILVRSPGPMLEGKKFLSGFAMGEDGLPYVILDVPGLLETEVRRKMETPSETVTLQEVVEKKKFKVMVVEDSSTVLNYEKDILQEAGFEVIPAVNGKDALSKFNEEIDLIVTDISMPEMDGLELTRRIKEIKNSIPVVVVSSLGSEEDIKQGLRAGADAYLVKKDFTPQIFLEKIKDLLRR